MTNPKRKRRTTQELLDDLEIEKKKIEEREKELITRRKNEIKKLEDKKIKTFYDAFVKKYPDLDKMTVEEISLFSDSMTELDTNKTIQLISDILN